MLHRRAGLDVAALVLTLKWPANSVNQAFSGGSITLETMHRSCEREASPAGRAQRHWRLIRTLCVEYPRAHRCCMQIPCCLPAIYRLPPALPQGSGEFILDDETGRGVLVIMQAHRNTQARACAEILCRLRRRMVLQKWRRTVAQAVAAGERAARRLEEELWKREGLVVQVSPAGKVRNAAGRDIQLRPRQLEVSASA